MMKMILRPTIYIGMGHTGSKVLRKTKKLIIEQYGEVPPMIQFLVLNTDKNEFDKLEDGVSFTNEEQCSISIPGNPIDYVMSHREELSWLPQINFSMARSLDCGAGGVRTNGRLAFVYNVSKIKKAIEKAYNDITSAAIENNENYRRSIESVQVNVVFSLAGGTGGGTFIDVAYLIRKLYGKGVDLQGYAIMPRVFREMVPIGPAMNRVFSNAFGALQDLDYLMHLKPDDEPVTFNWISEEFTKEDFLRVQTPFDLVYLIDNTNDRGIKYDNVMSLADVISLALAAACGERNSLADCTFQNVIRTINDGAYDVNNKKAWVSGFGASSVVFRGQEVADFYAKKVMLRLIQLLNNHMKDASSLASDWIDIDEIRIREDAGKDDVIDFLHEKRIRATLDIVDEKSPEVEVTQFCNSTLHSIREQVVRNAQELQERINANLSFKVAGLLKSGEGCVSTIADFLSSVKEHLSVGLQEMQDERKWFEEQSAGLLLKRNVSLKDLETKANRGWLFRRKKKIAEYKEDTCKVTENYLLNELEIIRRTYAIELFNLLMQSVDDYANQINKLKTSLLALLERLERSIIDDLNYCLYYTLGVDLTVEAIRSLEVRDETIGINEFFRELGDRNLYELNDSELEAALLVFARSQNEYEQWKNKTLLEAVNELDEDDFREVFRRAFEKAEPLLRIEPTGYCISPPAAMDVCFVCMDDTDYGRFLDCAHKACRYIGFVSSGFKDRIVFWRQKYVFPAYKVVGIDDWKREYDNSRISCHFDENIHLRMLREGFDILPSDINEEVLALWVKGLIFGLIRFNKNKGHGSYEIYNKKTGPSANDFWIDTKTYFRREAYEVFYAQSKDALEWFESEIENRKSQMGNERCQQLRDVVIYGANYPLHFSRYDLIGYTEVPIEVLVENMKNNVQEKLPHLKQRVQEDSLYLLNAEMEYVQEYLEKDF